MAQCIITSFENKVAVYFNDVIQNAEIEIADMNRQKLIVKNYRNIDYAVVELNDNITGYFHVNIHTENGNFNKRVFINTKKVKL